jgi:hypothetical protein
MAAMAGIDDGVPLLRHNRLMHVDTDIGEGNQVAEVIDSTRRKTPPSRTKGIILLLAPARGIPHFWL